MCECVRVWRWAEAQCHQVCVNVRWSVACIANSSEGSLIQRHSGVQIKAPKIPTGILWCSPFDDRWHWKFSHLTILGSLCVQRDQKHEAGKDTTVKIVSLIGLNSPRSTWVFLPGVQSPALSLSLVLRGPWICLVVVTLYRQWEKSLLVWGHCHYTGG